MSQSPQELLTACSVSGTPEDNYYSILVDDAQLCECLLALPEAPAEKPFVLDMANIAALQSEQGLFKLSKAEPNLSIETIGIGYPPLVVHTAFPQDRPRIYIPDVSLDDIVSFYHHALVHVGATRLHDTVRENFYHPRLRQTVNRLVLSCKTCQTVKPATKGYGHLPPRQAFVAPWHEVAVDLIGPWVVKGAGKSHTFTALTIIDTVSTYCEVILLKNKTAAHVGWQFKHQWLAQYPKPSRVVFDQGNEFLGKDFQSILQTHGITPAGSTVKNPQSNAVCERLHHGSLFLAHAGRRLQC